jgi:hypothetical protein
VGRRHPLHLTGNSAKAIEKLDENPPVSGPGSRNSGGGTGISVAIIEASGAIIGTLVAII